MLMKYQISIETTLCVSRENLISLLKVINTAFEWKALMAKPSVPGAGVNC